jgi:hypothetical protein
MKALIEFNTDTIEGYKGRKSFYQIMKLVKTDQLEKEMKNKKTIKHKIKSAVTKIINTSAFKGE